VCVCGGTNDHHAEEEQRREPAVPKPKKRKRRRRAQQCITFASTGVDDQRRAFCRHLPPPIGGDLFVLSVDVLA
jgi:hypothetical protein